MKETYEKLHIEVVTFKSDDIIICSGHSFVTILDDIIEGIEGGGNNK